MTLHGVDFPAFGGLKKKTLGVPQNEAQGILGELPRLKWGRILIHPRNVNLWEKVDPIGVFPIFVQPANRSLTNQIDFVMLITYQRPHTRGSALKRGECSQ